jgi:hypothetical protein
MMRQGMLLKDEIGVTREIASDLETVSTSEDEFSERLGSMENQW